MNERIELRGREKQVILNTFQLCQNTKTRFQLARQRDDVKKNLTR